MTKTLILAALLALGAVGAHAQQARPSELSASQSMTTSRSGIPPFNPDQGGTAAIQSSPTTQVFGVPVQVLAPVIPPYNHSAMQTLAGQPMFGRDAVIAQGMGGGMGGE